MAAKSAPLSVGEAAATGVQLTALEAIRDTLAAALDAASPAVAAQIAGQLRLTLADIAELVPAQKESTLDELKQRRDVKAAEPVAPSRRRGRVAGG